MIANTRTFKANIRLAELKQRRLRSVEVLEEGEKQIEELERQPAIAQSAIYTDADDRRLLVYFADRCVSNLPLTEVQGS
jgi:hypothetical protein